MTTTRPPTFEELLGKLYADRAAVDALVDRRPGLYTTVNVVAYLTDAGYSKAAAASAGQQLDNDKKIIRDSLSNIYDALDRTRDLFRRGLDAAQNGGRP